MFELADSYDPARAAIPMRGKKERKKEEETAYFTLLLKIRDKNCSCEERKEATLSQFKAFIRQKNSPPRDFRIYGFGGYLIKIVHISKRDVIMRVEPS